MHLCRSIRVPLLLLALLTATAAPAEEAPAGALPFPVARTTTVRAKDGPVYVIDGPTVIPKSVEIGVELDVTIVGINGASLEVQGGLKVRGTMDHWVTIRNVDFSPTRAPRKGLHLDMVNLQGVTFDHAEGDGFAGELTIENGTFQRDCAFKVRLKRGLLRLMTTEWGVDTAIICEPANGKTKEVRVQVRSSWMREVRFEGPGDVTFRHSEVRGGLHLHRVTRATVDGCEISKTLAIRQGAEDRFKGITLTKCNLFGPAILVLDRPENPRAKKESVKVDKFYFGPGPSGGGLTKASDIAAYVEDRTDVPTRLVAARITHPMPKRHHLVDTTMLRLRVPAVR